jgi:hypothetical protein
MRPEKVEGFYRSFLDEPGGRVLMAATTIAPSAALPN